MKNANSKQGFTLIEIVIAVSIVILLSALSIHGLLRARMTANEAAAINNLKALHTAFVNYRIVNPAYPQDLIELGTQNPPYVDITLAQGTKQGYNFQVAESEANTFRLAAVPVSSGVTGSRSFYINQGGEITDATGMGLGATVTPNSQIRDPDPDI